MLSCVGFASEEINSQELPNTTLALGSCKEGVHARGPVLSALPRHPQVVGQALQFVTDTAVQASDSLGLKCGACLILWPS